MFWQKYAEIYNEIDTVFQKKTSEASPVKRQRVVSRVPSKLAVERQIEGILKDKQTFDELRRTADIIKRKRRDRYLRLSGNVDYIDRNKDKVETIRSLSRAADFEQRRKVATVNHAQREEDDLKRRFMIIHRREINKQHVKSDILPLYSKKY